MYCVYIYIYRYDVLYTYIWCNVYSKGSEFGYNGIYVFIYLSINVCIYISCKSRKLVASSFKQAFFFPPSRTDHLTLPVLGWVETKNQSTQLRACGFRPFSLFYFGMLKWKRNLQRPAGINFCSRLFWLLDQHDFTTKIFKTQNALPERSVQDSKHHWGEEVSVRLLELNVHLSDICIDTGQGMPGVGHGPICSRRRQENWKLQWLSGTWNTEAASWFFRCS